MICENITTTTAAAVSSDRAQEIIEGAVHIENDSGFVLSVERVTVCTWYCFFLLFSPLGVWFTFSRADYRIFLPGNGNLHAT